jgi:ornithine carbamoyltransferase
MKLTRLISLADLDGKQVKGLLALAAAVKKDPGKYAGALTGKTLGMIFQKSSTRTRVSFEVGMFQLGGHALFLSSSDIQLGRGESVADTARVLSRYVDCVMARVFKHADIVTLADEATVPVINGLSDYLHPCQALADYQTIQERKGRLQGVRLAYVGDGNNVCHSLINGAARLGVQVSVACPEGYEPCQDLVAKARETGADNGFSVVVTRDPIEAVKGADVVYTDVWTSMGQESEKAARLKVFKPYQVNMALVRHAAPDWTFLHCLPAHRGEEVTDDVVDHAQSAILDQAENRLHAQKAVLLVLMGAAGL